MTKVKLRPLGDRVLIRPLETKEQKRGGIII
ncbi:MAG: co-chaperone GroES, partial [Elusimicrobia bacterium]|nr:co-chaperone GroES [Elusimicrobiota bacterium]